MLNNTKNPSVWSCQAGCKITLSVSPRTKVMSLTKTTIFFKVRSVFATTMIFRDCVRFELNLPALRVRTLKNATGERCECCERGVTASLIEIHCIPGTGSRKSNRDPSLYLLLLCPECHASLHRFDIPPEQQHLLVKARCQETAMRIQKAFRPARRYSPPECPDPADLFASALASGGMDLFLNGA
jgi:hypothetical protein